MHSLTPEVGTLGAVSSVYAHSLPSYARTSRTPRRERDARLDGQTRHTAGYDGI